MIEVNLLPGGKKRASRGPSLSFKLPSFDAVPKDPWVLGSSAVVIVVVALVGFLYWTTNGRHGELTVSLESAVADSARYADLIQQNDAVTARMNSIAQRVDVIQEILHRYVAIRRRDAIDPCVTVLLELADEVFDVDVESVLDARDLVRDHEDLSARDALHVAVMRRHGVRRILSFDKGFDQVEGLDRIAG